MHPDGQRAYVTNFGSNNFDPYGVTVSVIDLINNVISEDIFIGGIQPSGVAIDNNGNFAYISNYNTLYQVGSPTFSGLTPGQGTVSVIDTKTDTMLPLTIAVGQSPSNVTISPNGNRVYVSNFNSNTISVLAAL